METQKTVRIKKPSITTLVLPSYHFSGNEFLCSLNGFRFWKLPNIDDDHIDNYIDRKVDLRFFKSIEIIKPFHEIRETFGTPNVDLFTRGYYGWGLFVSLDLKTRDNHIRHFADCLYLLSREPVIISTRWDIYLCQFYNDMNAMRCIDLFEGGKIWRK